MTTFGRQPREAALRDVALVLVAVFGLAVCITLIWLGMRSVMDIGGACADGGPFVPVQPCPEGSAAALMLGMFGLFGFGGLGLYAGSRVGGGWVALPLLGWPALFGSLGWNFLEYGFTFEDGDPVWGWIVPGILFILMAVVPLWFVWWARGSATPLDARLGLSRGLDARATRDARNASSEPRPSHPSPADPSVEDPVDQLERLADLRRRGDLTGDEYERFKRALLRDVEHRG